MSDTLSPPVLHRARLRQPQQLQLAVQPRHAVPPGRARHNIVNPNTNGARSRAPSQHAVHS